MEGVTFNGDMRTELRSDKSLTGTIPAALGSLTSLDLSHNALTGDIPTSFSALDALTILDLSYNALTGDIPNYSLPTSEIPEFPTHQP